MIFSFIQGDGQAPMVNDGRVDQSYENDIKARTSAAMVLDDDFYREPVPDSGSLIYKCQHFEEGCSANLRLKKEGSVFRVVGDLNHKYQFHKKESTGNSKHLPEKEDDKEKGDMNTFLILFRKVILVSLLSGQC